MLVGLAPIDDLAVSCRRLPDCLRSKPITAFANAKALVIPSLASASGRAKDISPYAISENIAKVVKSFLSIKFGYVSADRMYMMRNAEHEGSFHPLLAKVKTTLGIGKVISAIVLEILNWYSLIRDNRHEGSGVMIANVVCRPSLSQVFLHNAFWQKCR